MKRSALNYIIDILSLIVMLGLLFTGALLCFVLPPGTGHTHAIWGLGRHDYGDIHFYFAIAAIVLLVIHIILHWDWMCITTAQILKLHKPTKTVKAIWGCAFLGLLLVIMLLVLWWMSCNIKIIPTNESHETSSAYLHQNHEVQPNHVNSYTIKGTENKHLESCQAGISITGRTTFAEAARICHLSVSQLAKKLSVPITVNSTETLGRLKRQYGFSIHDVRQVACSQ